MTRRQRAASSAASVVLIAAVAAVAAGAAAQTAPSPTPAPSASAPPSASAAPSMTAAPSVSAPPIAVVACTVDQIGTLENPRLGYRPAVAASVKIVYRNDRDAAATAVRFAVRYSGKDLTFDDRGTFAPHAKVDHDFTLYNTIYTGNSAGCSVSSATFADGTRWDAPTGGSAAAH